MNPRHWEDTWIAIVTARNVLKELFYYFRVIVLLQIEISKGIFFIFLLLYAPILLSF